MQTEILRAMSGEERLELAFGMSELAHDLSRTRIQNDHPEWSEREITLELLRLALLPAALPPQLR